MYGLHLWEVNNTCIYNFSRVHILKFKGCAVMLRYLFVEEYSFPVSSVNMLVTFASFNAWYMQFLRQLLST